MATGQIKKGFFFYFGMFALLLVTVFLICLVIMIFNPGQAVLWMKYFTGNETYQIVQTTGEAKQYIPWESVTDIVIKAPSYAKVTVQNTQMTNVGGSKKSDTGIYIKNHAKGFQGAAGAVEFGYEVTFKNGKLEISLKEPNGFLFFSTDLEVIIHTSTFSGQKNLNNKDLVIIGGKGNVSIGNVVNTNDKPVVFNSLYVSTTSGNVSLGRNLDTSSAEALTGSISQEDTGKSIPTPLYISTVSGDIGASQTVTSGTGLKINKSATFRTESGDVRLGRVEAGTNEISIECKKGTVVSSYMKAGKVSIKCTHGNYDINKVEGDLSFVDSLETIISPNITVGEVTGNFAIGRESTGSSPDVKINKVGGNVTADCDNGTLTINEIGGAVNINTKKMYVNVGLASTNNSRVLITNESAATKLTLRGNVGNRTGSSSDKISIKTRSSFNLVFEKNAAFRAVTYKYDSEKPDNKGDQLTEQEAKSRITVSGYEWAGNRSNFTPNSYSDSENITIITSGNVVFTMVEKID